MKKKVHVLDTPNNTMTLKDTLKGRSCTQKCLYSVTAFTTSSEAGDTGPAGTWQSRGCLVGGRVTGGARGTLLR